MARRGSGRFRAPTTSNASALITILASVSSAGRVAILSPVLVAARVTFISAVVSAALSVNSPSLSSPPA